MSAKRGTIDDVLWFWVVVLVVLIGAIAVVASGRGDSMVEVYDDRPDASLPADRVLNADDLRAVRLNTGVRGYRMDEVDALLGRLGAELLEREADEGVRIVGPGGVTSTEVGPAPHESPVENDGLEEPRVEDDGLEEPRVEDLQATRVAPPIGPDDDPPTDVLAADADAEAEPEAGSVGGDGLRRP